MSDALSAASASAAAPALAPVLPTGTPGAGTLGTGGSGDGSAGFADGRARNGRTRSARVHGTRRRRGKSDSRFFSMGLLFLLPALAGFALFYIWPFCVSLWYSVVDRPSSGVFVGLKNYVDLFATKSFLLGAANTARFIAISVPISMALSLWLSTLANRAGRYKDLCVVLFLVPLVVPSGSMVFFWRSMFEADGVLNGALAAADAAFGTTFGKVNWLDSGVAIGVMALIFIWKNLGYNMALYISGLVSVPKECQEAARADGASRGRVFWHVTLPHLAPTNVLVFTMSVVNSFKVFREIFLVTGNYPHESVYTLQHFMNNMFSSLNYPKLTSETAILVAVVALFTQTLLWLERRTQE